MKVLITGSAGFIFSNFVIYALQETNWDLASIDKLTYAGSLKNLPQGKIKRHNLYVGDICDQHFVDKVFEVEQPDIIIHGAAESMVDRSIKDSSVFIRTNVLGTQILLDAALKTKTIRKFINISTDEVMGSLVSGSANEEGKLSPRNPYAASKAAADLLGQAYFCTHGLPVLTTRCCNVYGPRQHPEKFIPKTIASVLSNKKVPVFGDGKNRREWIYVKDKFYALKTIMEKGKPGEVYNISTNQERDNLSVAKMIIKLAGANDSLIEFVEDRKGHDFRYSIDCSKLKSLGWKSQYSFEEALGHTLGWYKANPWGLKQ